MVNTKIEIATGQTGINWAAKGVERIAQNFQNLLSTNKYEVAYDRTLGMSGKFVDKPLDQAVALATAEIYELTTWEPRATVLAVEFQGLDYKGTMIFRVVIDIEY